MCYRIDLGEEGDKINVLCPDEAGNYGLSGWSLQTMSDEENADERFSVSVAEGLRKAFDRMGVRRAYAPKIVPTGIEIIDVKSFKKQINLGAGRFLYRSCSVSTDTKIGGMFLGKGCNLVMETNDFPIIVATAGENMIVAQAGFDSLIDREGVATGKPTRRHVSIVYAIVEAFIERGTSPNEIEMHMFFSIPKEKCKLADNNTLAESISCWCPKGVTRGHGNMFLNLEEIFLSQAHMVGVQNIRTNHPIVNYPAIAHAHDGKINPSINGREVKRKNIVVVRRHAA